MKTNWKECKVEARESAWWLAWNEVYEQIWGRSDSQPWDQISDQVRELVGEHVKEFFYEN